MLGSTALCIEHIYAMIVFTCLSVKVCAIITVSLSVYHVLGVCATNSTCLVGPACCNKGLIYIVSGNVTSWVWLMATTVLVSVLLIPELSIQRKKSS